LKGEVDRLVVVAHLAPTPGAEARSARGSEVLSARGS
jgi:hypothetical protein